MTWKEFYGEALASEETQKLRVKLKTLRETTNVIPIGKEVFNAFHLCPFDKLRIVIVGQDPYPNPDHAHGLAFSSNSNECPISLRNIFGEIWTELYDNGKDTPRIEDLFQSYNLTPWAKQGILLLNRTLTVEAGKSGSHHDLGWNTFTDFVLSKLSREYPTKLCFVLWGNEAQKVEPLLKTEGHLILKSAHPSPLSADKGFFGNGHFKQIQKFCRDLFFEPLKTTFTNVTEIEYFAEGLVLFFSSRGVQMEMDQARMVTKFIVGSIGPYVADLNPEIKKLYEIDFTLKKATN